MRMTQKTGIDFELDAIDGTDDKSLKALADKCKALENVEGLVERTEDALKVYKEQARILSEEDIPNFLAEKGLQSITLDNGTEVKIFEDIKPGVLVKNKEFVYNWLRDQGHGDLIKNNVAVTFGMGEDTEAAKLKIAIRNLGMACTEKEDVHYQTMKAFVSEQHRTGLSLPDEFGVHVANKTKLVQKKTIK